MKDRGWGGFVLPSLSLTGWTCAEGRVQPESWSAVQVTLCMTFFRGLSFMPLDLSDITYDHVTQMQGVFYGPRVMRWTLHPETVNRIVSLARKVVSVPILSPLIVRKISDKLVWVTTTVSPHMECKMNDPHVTCHTLSQCRVGGGDDTL